MAAPLAAADGSTRPRVIDGDTVELIQGAAVETVRLLGVDTPERGDHARCWIERLKAEQAAGFSQGFLAAGEFQVKRGKLDRYRRTLARLTVNGRDLAAALIAAGLGRAYAGGKRSGWCG